ncbi:RNA polymerase sigma-I factor [Virgibacillus sp. 179-BFC.A HS]|uniref:RNA polymerase sigma factor SigI n=1 Tax=Tigheibacillus jepli TaxID=3035914 RepID=A0ABU5CIU9_9BACI|nr:RNA polymerase sigma-I factor [Virgibacillus sp. 179-BFC.A HS]MDY0406282.1 RNA polymerase sigma-I factor [Virgibacillus sp. 179-BFC.A HS]
MLHKPLSKMPLEEKIIKAQQGDERMMNHLLETYQPFIAKCVSEVCKRYIDTTRDDEFSIGLSAFHNAIQTYRSDRGSSFLTFAKLVITRKVIDYIRYVKKGPEAVSLDENYDEEQMENPMEIAKVKEMYQLEQEAWQRKQEILDYKEKLKRYHLTLGELVDVSPKHQDARESAIKIARMLYNNHQFREFVQKKKKLPIKDLVKVVDVSKKTLERNRKYILAMFIVLSENYVFLQEYLKGVGQ